VSACSIPDGTELPAVDPPLRERLEAPIAGPAADAGGVVRFGRRRSRAGQQRRRRGFAPALAHFGEVFRRKLTTLVDHASRVERRRPGFPAGAS
jgi:hypothetical protein